MFATKASLEMLLPVATDQPQQQDQLRSFSPATPPLVEEMQSAVNDEAQPLVAASGITLATLTLNVSLSA